MSAENNPGRTPLQVDQVVAARNRNPRSVEETLRMAQRVAALDTQEGLGPLKALGKIKEHATESGLTTELELYGELIGRLTITIGGYRYKEKPLESIDGFITSWRGNSYSVVVNRSLPATEKLKAVLHLVTHRALDHFSSPNPPGIVISRKGDECLFMFITQEDAMAKEKAALKLEHSLHKWANYHALHPESPKKEWTRNRVLLKGILGTRLVTQLGRYVSQGSHMEPLLRS